MPLALDRLDDPDCLKLLRPPRGRVSSSPTYVSPLLYRAKWQVPYGKEWLMAARSGGIGLGGILVVLGIILIIFWSFWWGLIITLVGLVFFGGFAKGRWY
jgi:hypothetical protein